ncbi:MAG TPA: DUF502 domain-containing protein [Bacteroidota bacterium]
MPDLTGKTVLGHLRTVFLRGVGITIPLVLTYWVFQLLLGWVDGILSPFLADLVGRSIPGMGFAALLLLIMVVGLLTRNLVGRLLLAGFEDLLRSIPFVRSVYGAIKDLVGSFATGGKGRTFRKVILTEYPRPGIYVVGFVTNEMAYTAPDGRRLEFYNVYIPSPPNPTAGFLSLVPKDEAVVLNLTVEEGLKLVLSGGIIVPGELTGRSATEREHSLGTTTAG